MKLRKGQVVYVGRERFVDEIPDVKAQALGLKKEKKSEPKKSSGDRLAGDDK